MEVKRWEGQYTEDQWRSRHIGLNATFPRDAPPSVEEQWLWTPPPSAAAGPAAGAMVGDPAAKGRAKGKGKAKAKAATAKAKAKAATAKAKAKAAAAKAKAKAKAKN